MIVPILVGIVVARLLRTRALQAITMLAVCIILGLVSSFELVPLMYPFFAGEANYFGIPENRGVGLFFWSHDIMLFMDVIYIFQSVTSPLITMTLIVISILGGSIGLIIGIRMFPSPIDDKWLK